MHRQYTDVSACLGPRVPLYAYPCTHTHAHTEGTGCDCLAVITSCSGLCLCPACSCSSPAVSPYPAATGWSSSALSSAKHPTRPRTVHNEKFSALNTGSPRLRTWACSCLGVFGLGLFIVQKAFRRPLDPQLGYQPFHTVDFVPSWASPCLQHPGQSAWQVHAQWTLRSVWAEADRSGQVFFLFVGDNDLGTDTRGIEGGHS